MSNVVRVRCADVRDGWVTMFPVGRPTSKALMYPLADFDRMDFTPVPGMEFDLGIEHESTEIIGVVGTSWGTGDQPPRIFIEATTLSSVGNIKRPPAS